MTLNAAYFERKLRAILGLTGSNPIPELGDVAGFVNVENDRIEWALAGGEIYAAVQGGQSGVVGELSYVGIANPADSGVIGVVEDFDPAFVAVNTQLRVVTGTEFDTLFAGSVQASLVLLDGRVDQIGGLVGTPLRFIAGTQVAPGGLVFWNATTPPAIGKKPPQVVLGPRSACILTTVATNAVIANANWFARSRPLEGRLGIA